MNDAKHDPRPFWQRPAPSAARRAGDLLFAGGEGLFNGIDFRRDLSGDATFPLHGNSTELQLRHAYAVLEQALNAAGSGMDQILTINAFHAELGGIDPALRLRRDVFTMAGPPASTLVLVDCMPEPGAKVATDVIALANDASLARRHLLRAAPGSPLPAVGGLYGRPIFSQLVLGGGLIFSQGKGITAGPGLGSRSRPQEIWRAEAQTELTLDYLANLLADVGASLADVVRAEITLNDPRDMIAIDRVWRRRFQGTPPARVVLPARLALSEDVTVEISVIAVDPSGPYRREAVSAEGVVATGWESAAMRAGPYLFMSSLYAGEAAKTRRSDFVGAEATDAAERIADDIESLCRAAGGSIGDVVRRRSFHQGFADIAAIETIWRDRFGPIPPCTTLLGAATPFVVAGALQAADVIAWIP